MLSFQPTVFYLFFWQWLSELLWCGRKLSKIVYESCDCSVAFMWCHVIGPDLGLIYLFHGVEWNFTFCEVKEFFSLKTLTSVYQKGTHSPHIFVVILLWRLEFNTLLNMNVLALCVPLPSAKKENYCNNRHHRNTSSIFRPSQLISLTTFASSTWGKTKLT